MVAVLRIDAGLDFGHQVQQLLAVLRVRVDVRGAAAASEQRCCGRQCEERLAH